MYFFPTFNINVQTVVLIEVTVALDRLDVLVHVPVAPVVSKHHPPVIGRVSVNPDFVPREVAVGEEEDGAARPDAHGVHVVPVGPVGGEPPEPQLALRYDQPPPPGT